MTLDSPPHGIGLTPLHTLHTIRGIRRRDPVHWKVQGGADEGSVR